MRAILRCATRSVRRSGPRRRLGALAAALLVLGAAAPVASQPGTEATPSVYDLRFEATLVPTERIARAEIRVGRGASALHWVRLSIDPERHLDFSGDGEVQVEGEHVMWRPPATGGSLRYVFRIDHLRTSSSYDARCADRWALFRGGDLFPPARVRMDVGSVSRSTLRLRVPSGWSVATPWPTLGNARTTFRVDVPERSFDRPTGWMVMGKLGVLRERIAGTSVAIAGPVGQDLRRHDLLAFLRWTLPSLREAFGRLPPRLLLVGAGDPMWRGGLSGPGSAFLHADRPLIAHDGTSPVLHELVHVAMGARSGNGGDWIVEGLAEYYSVELLARSRTFTKGRVKRTFERIEERGREAVALGTGESSGDQTARAVGVMRALDKEIRERSDGDASLDDVATRLAEVPGEITPALLRSVAEQEVGGDLGDFFRRETGRVPKRLAPPAAEPPAPPAPAAEPEEGATAP